MKISKLILPILIVLIIIVVYLSYFSPSKGLGSFSDFDPNNNASKEIVVKIVEGRGFQMDPSSGSTVFYVEDKNGQQVMVTGPANISDEVRTSETVILNGHLHKEYFHASSVEAN